MEKDRKRALRRYHTSRMQQKAVRMLNEWNWFWNEENPKEKHDIARRWRDNMCRCSCSGCGNPRNHDWYPRRERLTMPERKAEDSYLNQLEELISED